MIFAHLPAGYIFTHFLHRKIVITPRVIWLGCFASILPDFDLLYFWFVDNMQVNHRLYWTHMPFFWCIAASTFSVLLKIVKGKWWNIYLSVFFSNICLHLVLDTMAAPIYWFYPFSIVPFYLIEIPANFDYWLLSFVFHWSFIIELAIICGALYISLRQMQWAKKYL